LQNLSNEFETQPRTRKITLRALESTLSVAAAHIAVNYDAAVQVSLSRRQGRVGREALIDDVVTRSHESRHDVSHEAVDAEMKRLEQRGLSGCFRDMQETVKRIRLQAPDQIQAAAFPASQWDYCSDLNWQIEMTECAMGIVCGIAILEPALRGSLEASNLYAPRRDIHALLAQAYIALGDGDRAAVHRRIAGK